MIIDDFTGHEHRYAYCMYNPLKYVDPSGERQMGWIYSTYQWEQEARAAVTKEWEKVYEVCTLSHNLTHSMACSIYSKGTDAWGNMRDPSTWSGSAKTRTRFDRGFTGHEHL
jgi:hypothetical protein